MRLNRRSLLALLGVPSVAPLVGGLAAAPASAAAEQPPSPDEGRRHVLVTAMVPDSYRLVRTRGEIDHDIGAIDFRLCGRLVCRHQIQYLITLSRPSLVELLPTTAQTTILLPPGTDRCDISVHSSGLAAGLGSLAVYYGVRDLRM